MELKTFRAKTMSDAMRAVKAALGADAVIVGAKPLAALGAAVGFEVTAHAPVKLSKPVADAGAFRSTPWAPSAATPAELPAARSAPAPAPTPRAHAPAPAPTAATPGRVLTRPAPEAQAPLAQVQRDLAEIKAMLASSLRAKPAHATVIPAPRPEPHDPAAALLRAAGLTPASPRPAGPVQDPAAAALAELRAQLPDVDLKALLVGPVALVGARGCGRTTAAVKLASALKFGLGRSVAILSLADDALEAEALARLADALEVPFASPGLSGDLPGALQDLGDVDVVLIDAPGLSPADPDGARVLRERLAEAGARTLAVLTATASASSAGRLCAQVAPFMPVAALLTRLDEAGVLGHWVQALSGAGRPTAATAAPAAAALAVGGLASGPEGPDGLEFCSPESWAARILEAGRHGAGLA